MKFLSILILCFLLITNSFAVSLNAPQVYAVKEERLMASNLDEPKKDYLSDGLAFILSLPLFMGGIGLLAAAGAGVGNSTGESVGLVLGGVGLLNYIWFGMLVISVVCSLFTGRSAELSRAVTDGADKAVKLVISMAGVMCLWTGILRIAEKSGVTEKISVLLAPVIKLIMPECRDNQKALEAVSANITANILGLGNAATPLGLKAMKELQKTVNPIYTTAKGTVLTLARAGDSDAIALLPYIGADELTNIAAHFTIDGEEYLVAPQLVRYGDRWYIVSMEGILSAMMDISPEDIWLCKG